MPSRSSRPLQLPFVAGDRWLGLEFPPDLTLDSDRLLYTAHFAVPFDAGAPQCGLLLDEWTETIPTDAVDTGITFHYDRPNSEAPQTMLLVTPSEFRGAWQWNDLVDALNETLDLAKRRVIEPAHLDASPYAPLLPATVAASQARQLTIAADLALNNAVALGPRARTMAANSSPPTLRRSWPRVPHPGVTLWNRLEGRPRAERFDRALRAEVRDALWMLAKQWQVGEFRGDDAGSPILAKARIETTRLTRYRPANGPVEPFDAAVPLEAIVERMPLALSQGGQEIALDLRLLLGRQWQKLIGSVAAATLPSLHHALPDSRRRIRRRPRMRGTCAHPEAWSAFAAVAGRRMDGAKLYAYLKDSAAHRASDGIARHRHGQKRSRSARRSVRALGRAALHAAGGRFRMGSRATRVCVRVLPHREAAQEKVLACDEYFRGRIDWYNFDIDAAAATLGEGTAVSEPPKRTTLTMLPTQATFHGMPNTRWWAFEDGRTNFGDVSPDTTDLGKLMLLEYRARLCERLAGRTLHGRGRLARQRARARRDERVR